MNSHKPKAIIFDLDSTLFNIDHRLHFILRNGKKDWDSFRDPWIMKQDTVYPTMVAIVRQFAELGYEMFIVTGRSDITHDTTFEQLKDHDIPHDGLFMRRNGDTRPSHEVKMEIYAKRIEPWYDVHLVIDDHPDIIREFRKLGIHALRAQMSPYTDNYNEVPHE